MVGRLPQRLSWLLAASLVAAEYDVDSLTFGKNGVISPSGSGIPGWQASSVNHQVQMLSDRVILTPPVPGNAKGSLWADTAASTGDWSASLDFRASGQETGSGNLQVWYAGYKEAIGTNSIYNVGNFDGLVIVVDQYGNTGGKVRGFLNDGTQDFNRHPNVESLAFGQCDYHYRNLGRLSKLTIRNNNGLTVLLDGQECFSSNKVSLPSGYFFGITASTGEQNPDSFEIHKFLVQAGLSGASSQQQTQQQNTQSQQNEQPLQSKMDAFPDAPHAIPDREAEDFKTSSSQFEDLHNRVQGLQHQLATVFMEFKQISDKLDQKSAEVQALVQNIGGSKETGIPPELVGKIQRMSEKVDKMEETLNVVKNDVEGKDYRQHLNDLKSAISQLHGGLREDLPDRILDIVRRHSPQFGWLIFTVVGVQFSIVGAYFVYKRRRNSMPKKYL
ncbi:hypothetical protein DOTSEDRAFT_174816 [Dothistroma septosporum NZE10]|uniref:L-type lectin-like domain-containing protein n=1 Tax=Dothistroma septosporum (strain NZE10 / CBS 128990) TaxID=675120 RepID=N1PL34_DOTSN|nr:hypothetical protein DOTSEDRAFT_174816 [Dothistroma septosporum NZE10]